MVPTTRNNDSLCSRHPASSVSATFESSQKMCLSHFQNCGWHNFRLGSCERKGSALALHRQGKSQMESCSAARRKSRRGRLYQGQPILLLYNRNEIFGEVLGESHRLYLVGLYDHDGPAGSISVAWRNGGWKDLTHRASVRVVEELSGAQLSRFMLYRDYSVSGCAPPAGLARRNSQKQGIMF